MKACFVGHGNFHAHLEVIDGLSACYLPSRQRVEVGIKSGGPEESLPRERRFRRRGFWVGKREDVFYVYVEEGLEDLGLSALFFLPGNKESYG